MKERGPSALEDGELIAVLLGSGSTENTVLHLARHLKKEIRNKAESLSLEDLLDYDGIGLAKASRILAGLELFRRILKDDGRVIESVEDALPLLEFIRNKRQEYFVCISLNGAHEVIENRVVTKGLVNKTQVHPREVFAPVLEDRATAVIFAHNHPSGSLEIGGKDRKLTEKLMEAADLLGIEVLDHLILAGSKYTSIVNDNF